MTRLSVFFEPLDLLLFRDHRPFDAGLHVHARSVLPHPSVIHGCLRTVLMRQAGARFDEVGFGLTGAAAEWLGDAKHPGSLRVRGPVLARRRLSDRANGAEQGAVEAFYPMPLDRSRTRRAPEGIAGVRLIGVRGAPVHLAIPKDPTERVKDEVERPQLLNEAGATCWSQGGSAALEDDHTVGLDTLVEAEIRTGIERDPKTGTVRESMFYQVKGWRFAPASATQGAAGIAVELELADAREVKEVQRLHGQVVALGGKAHRARIWVGAPFWPKAPTGVGATRVLLVSPLVPGELEPFGGALQCLVSDRAPPVGGYDLALKRPKPLRAVLPAGTVAELGSFDPRNDTFGQETAHHRAGYGAAIFGRIQA